MSALLGFLSGVWGRLAAIGIALLSAGLIVWRVVASIKDAERARIEAKMNKAAVKAVRKQKCDEDRLNALPDDALDDELRRQRDQLAR